MPPHPSLTLILAATPSLGIGKNGTLPWPQLKKEMGYFARVTKRVAAPVQGSGRKPINAVVMGRKTWDSIPERFRPLRDRVNVVVTRDVEGFSGRLEAKKGWEGPLAVGSIGAALEELGRFSASSHAARSSTEPTGEDQPLEISRIFVIGGSSIYSAALELPQTDRILLTKIKSEFDCDTFFQVDVEKEGSGWKKAGRKDVEGWTGEAIKAEGEEEAGVGFEFCMFERER
jgi:dihydrofolate reductase